jgi:DNA-binding ferritin-like protein
LHQAVAQQFRADAELAPSLFDPASGELFRSLVEYHEAQTWMLGELLHDRERAPA